MSCCEFTQCALPTIEGIVNERKAVFTVDTGASVSILDEALVRELGLEELSETGEGTGCGGRIELRKIKVNSIKVGHIEKRHAILHTTKLSKLAPLRGIDGIIGYDLLAGHIVALEPDGKARVESPDSIPARGLRVGFKLIGHLIGVDAFINGQGPFLFAVDTCASSSVLDKSLVAELGLKEEMAGESKSQVVCCAADAVEASGVTFDLRIGDYELKTYTAPVIDLSLVKEKYASELKGVVGYDILQRTEALIDYGSEQIFLTKVRRNHQNEEMQPA